MIGVVQTREIEMTTERFNLIKVLAFFHMKWECEMRNGLGLEFFVF